MGFSKCLYAATRCIVASKHQRVDIDTAAALAKASIEVEPITEAIAGIRIELHGVDLPDLGNRIESLCLGFPVEVLFNGKPLLRVAANLATMASPMGTVHLTGTRDGKFSYNTLVFLQGFCVMKPNYCPFDEVNIVHLDSRQFVARLPDRDKLIDEDVQRKRIDTELKARWRQTLEVAKAQLSPERFVAIYYAAMRAWGHWDLLNDLDVLPVELFDEIVGYPIQDDDRSYVRQVAVAPTRQAVESGAVTLVSLDWLDDDNAARWMLARAKGYLLFDWIGLSLSTGHGATCVSRPGNGADRGGVRTGPRPVGRALGVAHRDPVRGRAPTRRQQGRRSHRQGCLPPWCLVHPGRRDIRRTGAAGLVLHRRERPVPRFDLDADRDALADLIRRLRSVDPVQTLDSLLRRGNCGWAGIPCCTARPSRSPWVWALRPAIR